MSRRTTALKQRRGAREEDWSALEADRCLSVRVVGTLKRWAKGGLSSDADKFGIPRTAMWKATNFLRRAVVSRCEAGPLTLSYVWPLCCLFRIKPKARGDLGQTTCEVLREKEEDLPSVSESVEMLWKLGGTCDGPFQEDRTVPQVSDIERTGDEEMGSGRHKR